MAQIPDLLQLCAEKVAIAAIRNKKLRRYLKQMDFPNVIINYTVRLKFMSCGFPMFMNSAIKSAIVTRSIPTMVDNFEFRITVGDERTMWIATLGDLGMDMLKLDFIQGEYGIFPFDNGYLIRKVEYSPKIGELTYIFDTLNADKGLSGTYRRRPIKHAGQMEIFNRYISEYMLDNMWWYKYTIFKTRGVANYLRHHHKLPVIFYLTTPVTLDEVVHLKLTSRSHINNCGNVEVCWYVVHPDKGRIGIAVKQHSLFSMAEVRKGVGLLRLDKFRAVGNFEVRKYTAEDKVNPAVFMRGRGYACEFSPCFCDYRYIGSQQFVGRRSAL